MRELTALWDASCPLCRRCREWLDQQRALVPLRFVACASEEARATYGAIPWLGAELVVVSDAGDVWAGPAAFLMCLWALDDWREWSYALSSRFVSPFTERVIRALSSNRRTIAALVSPDTCTDAACRRPSAHVMHQASTAYR